MPRSSLGSILRFRLERVLERGPQYKVAAIWVLLLVLAVLGGALAWAAPAGNFDSLKDAIWWAFLNISDPGYLADTNAPGLRVLAVILAVLGLALFVGALVAVLTQSFNAWMAELALGTTPVTFDGHVAVLGWTSRTPELIAALLDDRAEIERVVVLVERVTPELRQEVRDRLSVRRLPHRMILRTGNPEQVEHLARANCRGARGIVIPADDPANRSESDARALKIVASLDGHTAHMSERPIVAVEVFQLLLLPVVEAAYPGPLQIIPTDVVLGRSLALGLLYPGFTSFLADILNPRTGTALQLAPQPELAGAALGDAVSRVQDGVLLGPLRTSADGEEQVEWGSSVVLQSEDEHLMVVRAGTPPTIAPTSPEAESQRVDASTSVHLEPRRILVVGWSNRIRDVLAELGHHEIRVDIDVLAETSLDTRASALAEFAVAPHLEIHHHLGDATSPELLEGLSLNRYDAIALLANEVVTDEESVDSRTIATLLVVDHCLRGAQSRPQRVVELLDPANALLLEDRGVEVVKTPEVVANSLAGAITHPRLWGVMPKFLQGALGYPCAVAASALLAPDGEAELASLEQALRRREMIWLGIQRAGSGYALELVPDKSERVRAADGDRVVLIRPKPQG